MLQGNILLDTPPQPSPIARTQGPWRVHKGKIPRKLGQSLEEAQEAAEQQNNDSDNEYLAPENLTQTGKERERQVYCPARDSVLGNKGDTTNDPLLSALCVGTVDLQVRLLAVVSLVKMTCDFILGLTGNEKRHEHIAPNSRRASTDVQGGATSDTSELRYV